jgi:hypothetical protein
MEFDERSSNQPLKGRDPMRPNRSFFRNLNLIILFILGFHFHNVSAGTPHLGYGTLRYSDSSIPSSVTFTAYILSRPGDVLTTSSFDCGYDNGTWYVQCGNFNSSWTTGDLLHVNFNDGSGNTGSVEVTLTNEPGDDAGYTFITSSNDQVKLLIPDLTLMRGATADIPIMLQGLSVSDSVLAYQLKIGFDSDVLLAVGATSAGTMTQLWGDPLSVPGENNIEIGAYTTNQPSTRMVPDAGKLVNSTFLIHGIPSSQTSNATIIRFLGAKIFTKNASYVISHTKSGVLTVQESPVTVTNQLTLYPNWNLISLAIAPDPNSLPDVFSANSVDYVFGYWSNKGPMSWDVNRPDFLNDLKYLDGLHGYWVKSSAVTSETWSVSGNSIAVDTPIPLYSGWNLMAYLPTQVDSIEHALQSLNDQYSYVMGFDAAVGMPRSWDRARPDFLNDLDQLSPLFGYWIKMDDSQTLVYPVGGYLSPKSMIPPPLVRSVQDTIYETNMVCDFWDFWTTEVTDILISDIITAYDEDGVLCGRDTVITDGVLTGFTIHVFGDDAITVDRDEGAVDEDTIRFYINGQLTDVVSGDNTWTELGSKQIRLALNTGFRDERNSHDLPVDMELHPNYPNPFNASTVIPYRLARESTIDIRIVNSLGRTVRNLLHNQKKSPGSHQVVWNGRNDANLFVPSGVYFIQLTSEKNIQYQKILFIK